MNIPLRKDLEVVRTKINREQITHICELLGIKNAVTADFIQFSLANAMLFDRKHSQYGPRNISAFGVHGVIVKCSDKYERIKHLFHTKQSKTRSDALEDSFRDFHNYGNIALMVENNVWPKD